MQHFIIQTKLRCDELEKENTTLKHQKDMLQDYHQKQKTRADNLDVQRKSLQDSIARLTDNEVNRTFKTFNLFLICCGYFISAR